MWESGYEPEVIRIGPVTPDRGWLTKRDLNSPVPGLFKQRLRSRGPWVPVKIWQIEERDPETKELMSDVQLYCQWAPITNKKQWVTVDPWVIWTRLYPIDEEEFRWLIAIKSL